MFEFAARVVLVAAVLVPGLAAADEKSAVAPSTPPPSPDVTAPAPGVAMNDHYLDQTLREMTSDIEGSDGRWLFTWFDVEMLMVSDEGADRMRVITPVGDADELGHLVSPRGDARAPGGVEQAGGHGGAHGT